jgi:hypothetical protein
MLNLIKIIKNINIYDTKLVWLIMKYILLYTYFIYKINIYIFFL